MNRLFHGASARQGAEAAQGQEPSVSLIDNDSRIENNAREESDAKLQEPLVTAFADRSSDSADAAHRKHRHPRHRKTLLLIFGQLFAAFVLAIAHFFCFYSLDGKIVDEVIISQTWVTATSFLLVTLIRGALTLCVGTSFVQYLWGMLQTEYLSLRDIERMFSLRTSLFAAINPQIAWKAPLLFSMGAYLWLLPVALIYPPGALIVSMDAYHSLQNLNMSVLNQTFANEFDPLDRDHRSWPSYLDNAKPHAYFKVLNSSTARVLYDNSTSWLLKRSLQSYAKFVLSNEQMSRVESPAQSRNSSYTLEFDAPQLNCTESHSNTIIYAPFSGFYYDSSTNLTTALRTYDTWNFLANSTFRDRFDINFARYIGYIPQDNYNLSSDAEDTETKFGIAAQIHTFSCQGYSTAFRANVTNRDNSQTITYTVHGSRRLRPIGPSFTWTDDKNSLDPENYDLDHLYSILPSGSTGYKDWATRQAPDYLRAVNTFNLFELAFGSIKGYLGTWIDLNVTKGVQCIKNGWLEVNGTESRQVDLCPLGSDDKYGGMGEADTPGDDAHGIEEANKRSFSKDMSSIGDSALNTQRFNGSVFNHLTDLNISTASLNQLLANISISMLTQNIFSDTVNVDVENFRNVYHFEQKVGFCVPYALCLAIAAMYSVIALFTLRKNGLPAADGGFLQIMMTTRGNTEMERLVVKHGPRSVDEIKGELAALRVRLEDVEFEDNGDAGDEGGGRKVRRRMEFRTEGEYDAGRRR
ncbi:hypothetical protein DE146DRAFT_642829 [Phaeosphaeria sp. MPI-PUGE-AT-0046c]|nr:hypothetical protein DE146DRAFT_642829 [Phaeosphaeria sp. MPI-PUGE-AT-0046c]